CPEDSGTLPIPQWVPLHHSLFLQSSHSFCPSLPPLSFSLFPSRRPWLGMKKDPSVPWWKNGRVSPPRAQMLRRVGRLSILRPGGALTNLGRCASSLLLRGHSPSGIKRLSCANLTRASEALSVFYAFASVCVGVCVCVYVCVL